MWRGQNIQRQNDSTQLRHFAVNIDIVLEKLSKKTEACNFQLDFSFQTQNILYSYFESSVIVINKI